MNDRLSKILLLLLAVALLVGASLAQRALNAERDQLGLTRVAPLDNAPPVLAFTTVALGGFRGLISNLLWIRANDLQDQDKFFEMVQLADWITKLEPHFTQVWLVQAWNMAYNISVKFKDFADRWRWVQAGLELLRDDGLRYNPNNVLIHRELAWFFQHKMGANLDDANLYYKQQWAEQISQALGPRGKPDFAALLDPQTDDQRTRARLLREKFKMDPAVMKAVDQHYGPLEWRLPEASAIYWAYVGLLKAQQFPGKVSKDDLITLRRVIYQSMQLAFYRGRLISNPFAKRFEFAPNLEILPQANAAYVQHMEEDAKDRDHIAHAHRNFLRDAVYFLYERGRLADAARWYRYLGQLYPNQNVIDGQPDSLPSKVSLDDYAIGRIQEDVGETSHDRVKAALEGMLFQSYENLALGEDEHAYGMKALAKKILDAYESKIPEDQKPRIGLPPFDDLDREVRRRVLDPEQGVPYEARQIIRTKLGLPAEAAPAPGANPPPATPPASTNLPTAAGGPSTTPSEP